MVLHCVSIPLDTSYLWLWVPSMMQGLFYDGRGLSVRCLSVMVGCWSESPAFSQTIFIGNVVFSHVWGVFHSQESFPLLVGLLFVTWTVHVLWSLLCGSYLSLSVDFALVWVMCVCCLHGGWLAQGLSFLLVWGTRCSLSILCYQGRMNYSLAAL